MKSYPSIIRASHPTLYPTWGKASQKFVVYADGDRATQREDILGYLADHYGAYETALYRQETFPTIEGRDRTVVIVYFWHSGSRRSSVK